MNALTRWWKRRGYLRDAKKAERAGHPVMAGIFRELAHGLQTAKPKTHNEASPLSSTRPRR
jgi:hypothetical protein